MFMTGKIFIHVNKHVIMYSVQEKEEFKKQK